MAVSTMLRVAGASALANTFVSILANSKAEQTRGQWYVVTVVDYAVILEFGSKNVPARPHWRPAMESVADEVSFGGPDNDEMIHAISVGGNLTRRMAIRLAKRIRALIRCGGMVDTGNYLASIAEGKTEAIAVAESESRLLDPSTSVLFASKLGEWSIRPWRVMGGRSR